MYPSGHYPMPTPPLMPSMMRSYLRVLHAAPGAPAVDVYANDKRIIQNLSFGQFSEYLPIMPGSYQVQVFPAGQTKNPVISTALTVNSQAVLTAAAIGQLPNLSLLPIADPSFCSYDGMAYIRLAHLSPNAPNVDITLPDGTVIIPNVGFGHVSAYVPVVPGTYTLQVRPAGGDQVVLTVPDLRLNANGIYTAYALGLVGGEPPLQALLSVDRQC